MKILPVGKKSLMAFALTVCTIFAVGFQRAEANPVKDIWDMLFDALDEISESLDNVHVDTWSGPEGYGDLVSRGWTRYVPAMQDTYFELNASIVCTFGTDGSGVNTTRISFRRSDSDPFLISLEAQAEGQTVELTTGPVVGYQSSMYRQYVVQCLPDATNTFGNVVTTVKFEALPEPDTGNCTNCPN